MLELPPLSLYVHVPWCVRKCPYCDFNSHEFQGALPEQEYVEALCEDLDAELSRVQARRLQSIFIGGGTPSLLSGESYARLIEHIEQRIGFENNIEITLEANPGTVEAGRFSAFRQAGINRLSLGIQSFDDAQLKQLGRIHDSAQAKKAIAIAQDAGFDNFNLDLMHGLPGQSVSGALADLQTALAYQPRHLSWYQLTIEPNTVFYRRPPPLPADELIADMQQEGQSLLAEHGLQQYEVSAYAHTDFASKHNLNYWQFGDYLGIGAGAHGKLSDPEAGEILRTRKKKQPGHYLQSTLERTGESATIAAEDLPLEFLLNALRLRAGFTRKQFEARTGLAFSVIGKRVEYLQSKQLLELDGDLIRTTTRGYLLLNSVLEEFL
jgi:oxygen-independent coproporphyrinogen-3 oxidase